MRIEPNKQMVKIVLDTNVIISGLNFPKSNPDQILTLIASGEILNFTSQPIIDETKRILADSFSWTKEEVEAAEFWLKIFSKLVNPKSRLKVIADDPDNRILECAVEARADFIISGDHHLTDLNTFQQIKIIKPFDFLKIFSQQ